MSNEGPIGSIVMWGGRDNIPEGWLECNGNLLSRSEFRELYETIGENFGEIRDPDAFYLPDLRGRFIRGFDGTAGRDPDQDSRTDMQNPDLRYSGVGSVQGDMFASHNHSYERFSGGNGLAGGSYWANGVDTTGSAGGKETRPINAYLSFIIRAK